MVEARVPSVTLPVSSSASRDDCTVEAFGLLADQPAQPDVAEVHQLAILDVAEIRRVGEHGIEAAGGSSTAVELAQWMATLRVPVAVHPLADPLALDGHAPCGRRRGATSNGASQ